MAANIVLPRYMRVGAGASRELAGLLQQLGVGHPFIVTDQDMVRFGYLDALTRGLDDAGIPYAVFADTVPDPTVASVNEGVAALKKQDHDGVVALGGGSPIDSAKAIAHLSVHGGRMRDYKAPVMSDTQGLPLVAIPTTAGTGSEATRFTVITDEETDEKMLCPGAAFCPVAALVDYELTLTMPRRLTADTGVDTLTHAIEAYVSAKRNPFSDGMAQMTMTAVARYLRTACDEPDNREAREGMMLAAMHGGMAFSNASVCMVHGMSRPIGAFFHVPHGLSNAMLLPAVTAFSIDAAPDRYAACARFMGVAGAEDSDGDACRKLLDELRRLNRDLGVPTPKDYGIDEQRYFDVLPTMAEQALASGSPGNNPRVPTADEIVEVYKQAWDGRG
ncbi:iron-containing alcohol dehydrogenase [Aquisalimonas lutea]|uniref:iron-containing alcohol dehydrogenase n=1 Tax=Aquisalimonas lutea TaxID=1327750 RepID=UPI0025B3A966|nr:iron-containing alcohol dehydrogenase [Aquisalimonas lutea]MDN3518979.1 iron-containing alcohol dehydrogenase [Aquisalimonas lutea]